MQIPSFLQKFGRDLVYLSIIAGLMGWIWVEDRRQVEYNTMIFRDMKNMGDIVLVYNEDLLLKIEKNSEYLKGQKGDEFRLKAILARKQVDAYKEMVSKLMQSLGSNNSENLYKFNRPISTQELESLSVFTKKLCDSLALYSDHDIDVSFNLKHFLSQDSASIFWKVAKSSKAHQTGVLLEDLVARTDLAFVESLRYLLSNTSTGTDSYEDWYPIISVSSEKSVIYPGQTYIAEIFLGQYENLKMYERNTTLRVDGKPFPIKDGLAHFSKRYTTSGEKKYRVDIELKNPVTKQVTSLTKEFALLVVDSCR